MRSKRFKSFSAYGAEKITERHRHRYEFNNDYKERFEKAGMVIVGTNPESGLCEILENKDHPWFVGVQFHPNSRASAPASVVSGAGEGGDGNA